MIADFAQMELVAAAVLAPEPKMLEAFQNGEDLHCRTASILLGRTVTKTDKAERSLAKAVNFGLLYGQQAPGLKTYAKSNYGVDMTEEESLQFRATFFQEYQGLAAWHESARADANNPEVDGSCRNVEPRSPGYTDTPSTSQPGVPSKTTVSFGQETRSTLSYPLLEVFRREFSRDH